MYMHKVPNTVVKNNHYVIIVDLPAPNITTGVVTHDSIEVKWNASAGATSYFISYNVTGGTTLPPVNTGDVTSYTLTNLMVITSYEITVQGETTNGRKSNLSNKVSVITGKWFITIIIS